MMRSYLIAAFLSLLVISALAQEKNGVPPPPRPADEGPTLEATMRFIQDKLNDIGAVNWALYIHDNDAGNDWIVKRKETVSNVVADAPACRISFHEKHEFNTQKEGEGDAWFDLKQVGDIEVMTYEQRKKEMDTAAGHTTWTYRADPPLFVLKVNRKDKLYSEFFFYREELANRVAKAMVHAVELCGGDSKPEPF
jgi:hypothetical protein